MGFSDLAIARNAQEYEILNRSSQGLKALSSISDGIRLHAAATASAGMRVAASMEALDQVQRANGLLLDDINLGLGVISDQLSEGFTQIAYEQRLQSQVLRSVLDKLSNPSTVAAEEYRSRGFYAYTNGWYEEAEAELKSAAERNPFDFTVHQVLGDIASRQLESLELAAEEFQKAAKYAQPVSEADAGYALMCAARALRQSGRGAQALVEAQKAVAMLPNTAEAQFALAQAGVAAGDEAVAYQALVRAILMKPQLAPLAAEDAVLAESSILESALAAAQSEMASTVCASWEKFRARLLFPYETASSLRLLWEEQERLAKQAESEKSSWSLFRKTPEPQARWALLNDPRTAANDARYFAQSIDEAIQRASILDLHWASNEIARYADDLVAAALAAFRRQYEVNTLSADAAQLLLDAMTRLRPGAIKTAACPNCGFKVSEWDDYCRSCSALFKGRLSVPNTLSMAYEDWLKDDRYWPRFLAQLDANLKALPHGSGAIARVNARFPKAAGRAGFTEIVARLEPA